MKNAIYNIGYFLKEAKTLFKIDLMSNILSILSIGLIFFILSLVISGWDIMTFMIETIEREGEINVYYEEDLDSWRDFKANRGYKKCRGGRRCKISR